CRPASIFVLLSLTFGSIIIFANPPLRGPDEIAHFLRIYSYSRVGFSPIPASGGRMVRSHAAVGCPHAAAPAADAAAPDAPEAPPRTATEAARRLPPHSGRKSWRRKRPQHTTETNHMNNTKSEFHKIDTGGDGHTCAFEYVPSAKRARAIYLVFDGKRIAHR